MTDKGELPPIGWRGVAERDHAGIVERARLASERAQERRLAQSPDPELSDEEESIHDWRAFQRSTEASPTSGDWRAACVPAEEQKQREDERRARMEQRAAKRAQQVQEAKRAWAKRHDHKDQRSDPLISKRVSQLPSSPSSSTLSGSSKRLRASTLSSASMLSSSLVTTQTENQEKREKREKKRRIKPPIDEAWVRQAGMRYLGRFSASERHFRSILMNKIKRAESRASEERSDHEAWVEAAVEEARRFGGIDDQRLALGLARSLCRRGLARRAAQLKLAQKKLSPQEIESALDEIYQSHEGQIDPTLYAATRAARKARIGPWGPEDLDHKARQKQLAKLARRGFSYAIAQKVLKASLEEAEEWLSGGDHL